ncbi:hypothetical protein E2C01_061162 [Portunus trituberculatus]|uniref:Uncharacterized protein n=1 Tax=Portunus trituberculatus TaxID=210409 RepID=A0A5B7H7E3_PORTR|nr:hypothetical protein [Portunus trituberculatus]
MIRKFENGDEVMCAEPLRQYVQGATRVDLVTPGGHFPAVLLLLPSRHASSS